MNKNQIGAVIICEDVRTELNGKQILIGVFSSDIIANNKGALNIAVWAEYTPRATGSDSVHFRYLVNNKQVAGVRLNISVQEANKIVGIATPTLPVQINDVGFLVIEMSSDGKTWLEVKKKEIKIAPILGAYPLSIMPSPSS